MSDGETVEEAIQNGRAAMRDTLRVFKTIGRKAPALRPEAAQWRRPVPRRLYVKLTQQAASEGVLSST